MTATPIAARLGHLPQQRLHSPALCSPGEQTKRGRLSKRSNKLFRQRAQMSHGEVSTKTRRGGNHHPLDPGGERPQQAAAGQTMCRLKVYPLLRFARCFNPKAPANYKTRSPTTRRAVGAPANSASSPGAHPAPTDSWSSVFISDPYIDQLSVCSDDSSSKPSPGADRF